VSGLIGILSNRAGLDNPPGYDADIIVEKIRIRDRGAMKLFSTWGNLASALDIGAPPSAENLTEYEIEPEMSNVSCRVLRNGAAEITGFSNDAMLITFRRATAMTAFRYLVIECENTAATRSLEYGLFAL